MPKSKLNNSKKQHRSSSNTKNGADSKTTTETITKAAAISPANLTPISINISDFNSNTTSLSSQNINNKKTNSFTTSSTSTCSTSSPNTTSGSIHSSNSKAANMKSIDLNNNQTGTLNRSNHPSSASFHSSAKIIPNTLYTSDTDLTSMNNDKEADSINNSKQKRREKSRKKKFHQLFPSVPLEEEVIETYSCAYVKSLNLYQGMMYVTDNFICFYSKILNQTNILIIKMEHINTISKSMHAMIFPTAIRIQTQNSTYAFTSFLSRSQAVELLNKLLKESRFGKSGGKLPFGGYDSINSPNEQEKEIEKKPLLMPMENNNKVLNVSEIDVDLDNTTDTNNNDTSIADEIDENNSSRESDESEELKNTTNLKNIKNQFAQKSSRKSAGTQSPSYYNETASTTNPDLIYDFDYSNLSENMVRISLRHKKTVLQKVKLIMSIFIPGFFNISRIDALLPICFTMCVLLLMNAFVLLNKVNRMDELFSEYLASNQFDLHLGSEIES